MKSSGARRVHMALLCRAPGVDSLLVLGKIMSDSAQTGSALIPVRASSVQGSGPNVKNSQLFSKSLSAKGMWKSNV